MAIRNELIEELLDGKDPQQVFAQDGLLDELKRALAERILNAEMDQHLASERCETDGTEARNHRNGHTRKAVLTGSGKLELQVPRDRQASFEPQLIAKYRRRFPDFDDKVISLYARGMTVREIQGHLRELYGIDVSPDLISVVTDAVLEQVTEWQNRPLDALHALVFFDALRVKIRDEGTVRNKAVYLALGVRPDGTKEILGLWIEQTEGAKFWLRVMNELRNRGVADMLIAVVTPARARCRSPRSSRPAACGNSAPAAATAGRAQGRRRVRTFLPRTRRSGIRAAPLAACRRRRGPASAAAPPRSPASPSVVPAAVPEPSATSHPRQTASESKLSRFRQRAAKALRRSSGSGWRGPRASRAGAKARSPV